MKNHKKRPGKKSRPVHQKKRQALKRAAGCDRCVFERLPDKLRLDILANPETYPGINFEHTCGKENGLQPVSRVDATYGSKEVVTAVVDAGAG